MNLKQIQEMLEREIATLEEGVYVFETVTQKRYDADKKILREMKDHQIKVAALAEKVQEGKEVTQQEIHEAVPPSLR